MTFVYYLKKLTLILILLHEQNQELKRIQFSLYLIGEFTNEHTPTEIADRGALLYIKKATLSSKK